MKSFHGDKKIKETYLQRVRAHRKADEIIKGKYWENGKGCAVGCTIHSNKHHAYETELGIPEWLARLEDGLFEVIPNEEALLWPEKFLEAIPLGVDLEQVKAPFLIYVLQTTLTTFNHKKYPDVKKAIDRVIALYEDKNATLSDFEAVRTVAYDAAAYDAATAAAYAAAAAYDAATAAAYAAAAAYDAAATAAYAAAAAYDAAATAAAAYDDAATAAAAYDDARSKTLVKFSEHLLKLFREAK